MDGRRFPKKLSGDLSSSKERVVACLLGYHSAEVSSRRMTAYEKTLGKIGLQQLGIFDGLVIMSELCNMIRERIPHTHFRTA